MPYTYSESLWQQIWRLARPGRASPLQCLLAALVCAASAAAQPAGTEPRCWLSCGKADQPGQACAVGPKAQAILDEARFKLFDNCDRLVVTSERPVVLRYRHAGKWYDPPQALGKSTALQKVFAMFKPDPCGVPTSDCLQQRMGSKVASAAGHGADSLKTNPMGVGQPCLLGLPCGAVLPPPQTWKFRISEDAFNGRWQVALQRGQPGPGRPAETSAEVRQGVVAARGDDFVPGGIYSYQLFDVSGNQRAQGEFQVVSATSLNRLKTLAAARAERLSLGEAAAWMDTLAASELDWDAQQLASDR